MPHPGHQPAAREEIIERIGEKMAVDAGGPGRNLAGLRLRPREDGAVVGPKIIAVQRAQNMPEARAGAFWNVDADQHESRRGDAGFRPQLRKWSLSRASAFSISSFTEFPARGMK